MRRVYERDLVEIVADYFRRKGYAVVTEVFEGIGRADLVALKLNPHEVRQRIDHGIIKLPVKKVLKILNILEKHNEGVELKKIAADFTVSDGYIRRIVSEINPLFVKKERKGNKVIVKKLRSYRPVADEVISIELKLANWRSGLIQAHMYLLSSHKTYLAIYSRNIRYIPPEVIEWTSKKGIGILSVSKTHGVREVIPAKNAGPKSKTSYYLLTEEAWSALVRRGNQFSQNIQPSF